MCSRMKELTASWDKEIDEEDRARIKVKTGDFLGAILGLLDAGLTSLAKVYCADHGEKLNDNEKGRVVLAFVNADDVEYARRFRYRHRLGAILPKHHPAIRATRTYK